MNNNKQNGVNGAVAPMKWSDLDPYLKALHLGGNAVTVTVERIEFHKVHPRPGVEEIRPVMYFQKKQKGLILNNGNQDFLRTNFGDDISECYGQVVTLTPTKKNVAGRVMDVVVLGLPKSA